MKKTLLLALSLLSLNTLAFASEVIETQKCKSRAETVAFMKAQKELIDINDMISVTTRAQSILEHEIIYHFVDISSTSSYKTKLITVGLELKTCRVKSID